MAASLLYQLYLDEKKQTPNYNQLIAFAKIKGRKLKYVEAKRIIGDHKNSTNTSNKHGQNNTLKLSANSSQLHNIIFKDNKQECIRKKPIIENCQFVKRLIAALLYYDTLDISNKKTDKHQLISFCETTYESLLNDYIHLMCEHCDDLQEIHQSYRQNYDISSCNLHHKCDAAVRHQRNRNISKSVQHSYHFYVDIFDSLHFYIIHLYSSGIRIKPQEIHNLLHKASANKTKYDCFDVEFSELRQLIQKKRSVSSVSGSTQINKFDIQFGVKKGEGIDEETFMCAMLLQCSPINEMGEIGVLLQDEEYDTDSIIQDIADTNGDFLHDSWSNINNLIHDEQLFVSIRQFIDNNQLSNSSFSIGLIFYYWPYYKHYMEKKTDRINVNHHSGYAIKELYVEHKYESLKEELLASHFISTHDFDELIMKKATAFMDTNRVKQTTAAGGDWMRFLHYDIKENTPLSIENLVCLIVYCDFTQLCTEFKSTFRPMKLFESLSSIKRRNKEYWWLSKILRETVQIFGDNRDGRNYGNRRKNVTGPFYCGMTFLMAIPEFNIRLCSPTSTSKLIEVAARFGKEHGMIIQVNNNGDAASARYLRCFQCSWLSCYPHEEEYLFFGGDYRIRIESIRNIETCQNFEMFITPLFYFDEMINGSDPLGSYNKISHKKLSVAVSILQKLIEHETGSAQHQIEAYVLNTFHLFCLKKTQIIINLCFMDLYFKALYPLIMNQIKRSDINWKNDMSQNNLFSSVIFRLFTNVKEIIIYTTATMVHSHHSYSFSLKSLFLVINELRMKLKIKIYATQKNKHARSWLFDAYHGDYTYELKTLFTEKQWRANITAVTNDNGEKEDCVIIHNADDDIYANISQMSMASLFSMNNSCSLLDMQSTTNLLTQQYTGAYNNYNVTQRKQYCGYYRASYASAQYPKAPFNPKALPKLHAQASNSLSPSISETDLVAVATASQPFATISPITPHPQTAALTPLYPSQLHLVASRSVFPQHPATNVSHYSQLTQTTNIEEYKHIQIKNNEYDETAQEYNDNPLYGERNHNPLFVKKQLHPAPNRARHQSVPSSSQLQQNQLAEPFTKRRQTTDASFGRYWNIDEQLEQITNSSSGSIDYGTYRYMDHEYVEMYSTQLMHNSASRNSNVHQTNLAPISQFTKHKSIVSSSKLLRLQNKLKEVRSKHKQTIDAFENASSESIDTEQLQEHYDNPLHKERSRNPLFGDNHNPESGKQNHRNKKFRAPPTSPLPPLPQSRNRPNSAPPTPYIATNDAYMNNMQRTRAYANTLIPQNVNTQTTQAIKKQSVIQDDDDDDDDDDTQRSSEEKSRFPIENIENKEPEMELMIMNQYIMKQMMKFKQMYSMDRLSKMCEENSENLANSNSELNRNLHEYKRNVLNMMETLKSFDQCIEDTQSKISSLSIVFRRL